MRVALDGEELFDFYRAVFADAAEIVAAEVYKHDVFRAFFFTGEHFALEPLVFGFVFPAAARAGNGAIENVASLDFDKHFRRTADDRNVIQLKIKKIRRGIQRTQLAINLKRISLGVHGKTLAQNDLENVACADVLLGLENDIQIFGAAEVR